MTSYTSYEPAGLDLIWSLKKKKGANFIGGPFIWPFYYYYSASGFLTRRLQSTVYHEPLWQASGLQRSLPHHESLFTPPWSKYFLVKSCTFYVKEINNKNPIYLCTFFPPSSIGDDIYMYMFCFCVNVIL